MKKIVKIFIVAATAFLAAEVSSDAQVLKSLLNKATSTTTETTSEGTSCGKAAGSALKSLYTQYKKDGKLDMSNLTNLMYLTTLATNLQELKGQSNKSTFYKDFAAGLISGSNNLINSSNSSSVMSALTNLDLSGLSGATSKATKAVEDASEIASSVSSILNLFK